VYSTLQSILNMLAHTHTIPQTMTCAHKQKNGCKVTNNNYWYHHCNWNTMPANGLSRKDVCR